jgi:chromosome segregation ATPase
MRVKELEEELRLRDSQIQKLNEKNKILSQDYHLLKMENESNLSQHKALSKCQDEWRDEKTQLKNQLRKLTEQLEEKTNETSDLQYKLQQIQRSPQIMSDTQDQFNQETDRLRGEIKQIKV